MKGSITEIYRPNLAMLTDLYQLTMAYGYWKLGQQAEQACFSLYFRELPFKGGYAIAAGLEHAVQVMQQFRFGREDVDYLATLTGADNTPLFDKGFLDYLVKLEFTCDVHAIPEGTVVYPLEPLVRVTGSLLQCQLLETILLNVTNYQTLVATKSSRVCAAARGEPVIEFGLRRAQGPDGALTASRAAYIGGCAGTSNVLAGRLYGIPVKGTHAHSWVMSFDSEAEAFAAYAQAMPNNCVFLVDTYDTRAGVANAIAAARELQKQGHKLLGIRLDSGDLAYLSILARRMLDEAGFKDAVIMASNDIDETILDSLKQQGATINVWGIGTRLVTAYDQPALGGVYKLGAIRKSAADLWQLKMKVSDQMAKSTIPGVLQVRRFTSADGFFAGDMIYDQAQFGPPPAGADSWIVSPHDVTVRKHVPAGATYGDLLVEIFRGGKCVYDCPSLQAIRKHVADQLQKLHPGIRRRINPHVYPVGLEPRLHELRTEQIVATHAAAH